MRSGAWWGTTATGLSLIIGSGCPQNDGEAFSAGLEAGDELATEDDDPDGDTECGNGTVEPGEQCDLGEGNGEHDACTPECQLATCGDGYTQSVYEECDDGNSSETDYCLNDCKHNVCGDGLVNEGVEACDDGNADDLDDCKNDCTLGSCGNGTVEGSEQCDDGNEIHTDGCAGCHFPFCGDGYAQVGVEECDDGNREQNDACLDGCIAATCGDGILWTGEETCDDGNLDDDDECPGSCEPASCGDGFVWAGMETCDDTNHVDDDGCDAECNAEYCVLVDNGPDEDLIGNDWFDTCVEHPGASITIKLKDPQGNVVYQAEGTMVGDWTYGEITSTGNSAIEYNENSHDRLVPLDNGDKLFIAGRDADPGEGNYFCNTDLGQGYGIVIYPGTPNWYYNAKIVVMPYEGHLSGEPRQFKDWGQEYEISYNGGTPMNLCTQGAGGLVPYEGEFTLRVEAP